MKALLAAALILAAAHAQGGTGALVLAAIVLAAVWVLICWRRPYRPCPRCKGRRRGTCKRCGATRHVQRPGARLVHGALLSIRTQIRNRKENDHV